jgi:hypothetical protein
VGYRPPPVIYAAEAMPRDIQMQLVAPPMYQTQRAYSVQEIATNHDVREMMPGIEIDTLNFDFGSAEVRPEEIDKLDEIGIVIESIVAERPDEVFLIEGHTDAVGSDAANDALSQRRALAVREALLDYFIIDPGKPADRRSRRALPQDPDPGAGGREPPRDGAAHHAAAGRPRLTVRHCPNRRAGINDNALS